jgi:hypothetical protein
MGSDREKGPFIRRGDFTWRKSQVKVSLAFLPSLGKLFYLFLGQEKSAKKAHRNHPVRFSDSL